KRFRARRGHGCCEDKHREDWRSRGCPISLWKRYNHSSEDSADVSHNPGPNREVRGRALCDPTSKPARTGAARSREGLEENRDGARRSRLPIEGPASTLGLPQTRTEVQPSGFHGYRNGGV